MKKENINLLLIICIIVISLFGLVMIYSASNIWAEYKFNNPYKFVIHQGVFLIIGLILMTVLSKIDYHFYYEKANKIILVYNFINFSINTGYWNNQKWKS